ncbi:MAG: thiamine pyrophosphate-dependent dehydrogenase E1 component subunit alpha [Bacilli bacterium]|nr:thiamine pyrophosphate-dependent dehydrogenase E1 component subunit alpha [Bacilli bacterium]
MMITIAHGEIEIEVYTPSLKLEKQVFNRGNLIKSIDKVILIKIYRNMIRTRCFDEKIKELISEGFHINEHSTLGQEAGPVAACAALNDDDYMMPYHRGWAWGIGKGLDPKYMLAELLGKKTGYMHGRGGVHFACMEKGVLGKSGVVGANIPIAAGVGLAINRFNKKNVCLSFMGNAACNTGSFHEGLNLAALWKSPVIYFCENNFYQISCSYEETTACENLINRAISYDIPGYLIDGNDAIAVYYVTKKCVEYAREGKGPSFIESHTYRIDGHFQKDFHSNGGYRSLEEIEKWKKKDPIELMEKDLLEFEILDKNDMKQILFDAKAEMDNAAKFAIESPYPSKEDFVSGVFAD